MLDSLGRSKLTDEDEILNIDKAAELLGLKKSTLYQKVHYGSIPYFKSPGGKILQFKRSELLSWLESNRKEKFL
jgi:excisionase family DNA binding protein